MKKYLQSCLWIILLVVVFYPKVTVATGNTALILKDAAYVVIDGGSAGKAVYLVINTSDTSGISRTGNALGCILTGTSDTSSSVVQDSTFVKWNMGTATGSYIFPFGKKGALTPLPMTFKKLSATDNTNISATTRACKTNNTPVPSGVGGMFNQAPGVTTDVSAESVVDRWWVIISSGTISNGGADVTYSYDGSENTTDNPMQGAGMFQAQHWNGDTTGGQSGWDPPVVLTSGVSGQTAGTAYSVTIPAAKTFSPWVVVNGHNHLLPIILTQFTATCKNKNVELDWTTASEINNAFFTIERTYDGLGFEKIAKVSGSGNTTVPRNYSFTDTSSLKDVDSYYRLTQTDFNGNSKSFPLVSASCNTTAKGIDPTQEVGIKVFPNPTSDNIYYELYTTGDATVNVRVIDVMGREVQSYNDDVKKGSTLRTLSLANYNSASYILQVSVTSADGTIKNQRFEKVFVINR